MGGRVSPGGPAPAQQTRFKLEPATLNVHRLSKPANPLLHPFIPAQQSGSRGLPLARMSPSCPSGSSSAGLCGAAMRMLVRGTGGPAGGVCMHSGDGHPNHQCLIVGQLFLFIAQQLILISNMF